MGNKISASAKKHKDIFHHIQSATLKKKFSHHTHTDDHVTEHTEKSSDFEKSSENDTHSTSGNDSVFLSSRRKFHHVQNSAYWLPNDDEEMDRLIGQHFAIKTLFNGNIYHSIINTLDMENQPANILDIGCGPGTWIMDVATEYPLSQFTGVDMCDIFPTNVRPSNVNFEVGNLLDGLDYPDNTFDFINARLFIIALKKEEWVVVMKEAYRLLKPGGFLQCVECGMLEKGNGFVRNAGKTFKEVIEKRGQEPYIAYKLPSLLENLDFYVSHVENNDIYLGKPNAVSREFLWDVCNIFKSAEVFLADALGYSSDDYPEFLTLLCTELQKQPDAMWSFSIIVGQK
ncbi:S-adenosyl-L-methionine-dependent methyltransferase [Pilobolus umbonatus]|nr:S-adenosyl-L-methionine-dependent methyltransferase [Pilobolus umbonatus]